MWFELRLGYQLWGTYGQVAQGLDWWLDKFMLKFEPDVIWGTSIMVASDLIMVKGMEYQSVESYSVIIQGIFLKHNIILQYDIITDA